MKPYNGFTPADRSRALRWLNAEYAAGRRTRPTRCDACGQMDGLIEPHSEDYSAPYGDNIGAFGLCYRCHMILHCRFNQPVAFQLYVETVLRGVRWPPLPSRDFPAIQRMFAMGSGRDNGQSGLRLDMARPGWAHREPGDGDPSLLLRMAHGDFKPVPA